MERIGGRRWEPDVLKEKASQDYILSLFLPVFTSPLALLSSTLQPCPCFLHRPQSSLSAVGSP